MNKAFGHKLNFPGYIAQRPLRHKLHPASSSVDVVLFSPQGVPDKLCDRSYLYLDFDKIQGIVMLL